MMGRASAFPPFSKGIMRAFILGNSGELLDHDLSLLQDEIVYAVNALPLRAPEIMNYYACLDTGMAYVPELRALVPETCEKYYGRLMWNGIHHEDNVNVFDTYSDNEIGFNASTEKVYPCGTVTYCALQLAVALGYDEIYLLGIDLGYPTNGTMHIPEQDIMMKIIEDKNLAIPSVDKRFNNPGFDKMSKGMNMRFAYASAILRDQGISVINLSSGGNLNCFKRLSFKEVIKDKEIIKCKDSQALNNTQAITQ
jgi:hypothetical protein